MTIPERIKLYLRLHGISQKYLAANMHMLQPKISQILNGKQRMLLDEYMRLCDVLGVEYTCFFSDHIE